MFYGVVSWYCRSFFSSEKRFGGKSLWNGEGKGLQWCEFHITYDYSEVDMAKCCIYCILVWWVKNKKSKTKSIPFFNLHRNLFLNIRIISYLMDFTQSKLFSFRSQWYEMISSFFFFFAKQVITLDLPGIQPARHL